jgi:predicted ABC-class ATPase
MLPTGSTKSRGDKIKMSQQTPKVAAARLVDRAFRENDTAEGAAQWLATYIANTAMDSPNRYVPASFVEAYRQVRAAADAEAMNV